MQKLHDRYAIVDYGFKMSSQLLPGQRDSLVFPRTCLSCLHRHPNGDSAVEFSFESRLNKRAHVPSNPPNASVFTPPPLDLPYSLAKTRSFLLRLLHFDQSLLLSASASASPSRPRLIAILLLPRRPSDYGATNDSLTIHLTVSSIRECSTPSISPPRSHSSTISLRNDCLVPVGSGSRANPSWGPEWSSGSAVSVDRSIGTRGTSPPDNQVDKAPHHLSDRSYSLVLGFGEASPRKHHLESHLSTP